MKERRKNERRRWGRKVTYPFIDSEGVLVTKNRRRKIDRRDVIEDEVDEAVEENSEIAPVAAAAKNEQPKSNTSVSISESKVMELEDALQDTDEPASNIMESIKDLENEILDATDEKSKSSARLEVISAKNSPADKQAAVQKTEKPATEPETKKEAKPEAEKENKKEAAKEDIPANKVNAEEKSDSKEAQDSAELPEIDINAEDTPKPKAKAKPKPKPKPNRMAKALQLSYS